MRPLTFIFMPKKAQEFLLDTQLGEKTYSVGNGQKPVDDGVVHLNIERDATPVALLREVAQRTAAKGGRKSWFARLDEKVQSLSGIKPKDLAVFFRLLAVMINAGIPLIRSLEVVAKD